MKVTKGKSPKRYNFQYLYEIYWWQKFSIKTYYDLTVGISLFNYRLHVYVQFVAIKQHMKIVMQ